MGNYDGNTGEFDYTAACEVDRAAKVPDGMISWHLPSQTYAVFTCTLPTLRATYNTIYQTWLPTSSYRHGAGPEFELYDAQFDPSDANSKMSIYIPVKRQ
jgi:AraC family transcriptional regulator